MVVSGEAVRGKRATLVGADFRVVEHAWSQ
jgi:hypothetical protein